MPEKHACPKDDCLQTLQEILHNSKMIGLWTAAQQGVEDQAWNLRSVHMTWSLTKSAHTSAVKKRKTPNWCLIAIRWWEQAGTRDRDRTVYFRRTESKISLHTLRSGICWKIPGKGQLLRIHAIEMISAELRAYSQGTQQQFSARMRSLSQKSRDTCCDGPFAHSQISKKCGGTFWIILHSRVSHILEYVMEHCRETKVKKDTPDYLTFQDMSHSREWRGTLQRDKHAGRCTRLCHKSRSNTPNTTQNMSQTNK